ncbi:replication initiator protein [Sigmofec virus UA08Rod_5228]|uniref:Replication initiator protein n=1 Tax=Sigmofec virus UA08Rod_5228 TaxID=2929416 RepID=A0A976N1Y5_9VIRU|nr:replication initiator protein [Sigmofec virus UA08Rod_5228]
MANVPTFLERKLVEMSCFNPQRAWKLKFSGLPTWVDPKGYEIQKKITFKRPTNIENYQELEIPCGKCLGCRLDHANSWALRIMCESLSHKKNCFITLTYDNKNLNIANNHMTLVKKDMQDFIKRLRERTGIKLSYFLCGEYGSKTHRPHGHAIIFGYEPDDLKLHRFSATDNKMFTSEKLAKIWGKGYVCVQELNYKTACYTARYVQKKAGLTPTKKILTGETEFKDKIDERTGESYTSIINKRYVDKNDKYGREKEFIIMSKKPAIGLRYWNENKEKIKRNGGILIKLDDKVVLKPIPRYYKKLWEQEDWENLYKYKMECQKTLAKNRQETLEKISTSSKKCEELTEKEKMKIYNQYLEKNLKERGKYLKRSQC